MILESAQILCTVLHEQGMVAPYRPTHRRHPCVIWAGESLENWLWLRDLTFALNEEYQYRFLHQTSHKSCLVVAALDMPPLPSLGQTQHPQVMPEQYRVINNPVAAYRQLYLTEKRHLLQYTRRKIPSWIQGSI